MSHQLKVALVIFVAKERRLTAISTLRDVMRETRGHNSCQSSHDQKLSLKRPTVNYVWCPPISTVPRTPAVNCVWCPSNPLLSIAYGVPRTILRMVSPEPLCPQNPCCQLRMVSPEPSNPCCQLRMVSPEPNPTTYKLAFKLAHNGKELDDKEVERNAAMKGIMGWVRLHPYNISQKVQVVVEHFRQYVSPLLKGQAKAMVVVGSRQEAVRWKIAIDKYIKDRGYGIGTLVAFSGEVKDKESGPDPLHRKQPMLNPNLRGRDIREAFNTDEFQILLVANKFQTGFDQPLLCGMYVDKRLAGIQAVQTLSRLNRAHPGKDTTYVLDFVNDTEDVLKAFKTYYSTAELANVSDPNLVYNLRAKLDAAGHYDDFEVDRVVAVELKPNAKQSELAAAVEPVVDRLQKRYKAAQAALKTRPGAEK